MINRLLRAGATAFHKMFTVGWFFRRPRTFPYPTFILVLTLVKVLVS